MSNVKLNRYTIMTNGTDFKLLEVIASLRKRRWKIVRTNMINFIR